MIIFSLYNIEYYYETGSKRKRSEDYFVRCANSRSRPLVGSYLAPHKFNNYKAVRMSWGEGRKREFTVGRM